MNETAWGERLLGSEGARLVLASASPRRAEILTRLGVRFTVHPVAIAEEIHAGEPPEAAARRLAEEKARAAARSLHQNGGTAGETAPVLVVGSDTLVVLDGRPLGKPRDASEARGWLRSLSGRAHEVVTGVAVLRLPEGGMVSGVERTVVRFRPLTEEDVTALVESGEALDKAGAYGIQGLAALAVEGIEGDYSNVVGLPLGLLRRLVREALAPGSGGAGETVGAKAWDAPLDPVRWRDGAVRLVDQRLLPRELVYRDCREVEEVAEAIETLAVRGAPAIGIAAAYGVVLGATRARERGGDVVGAAREAVERLRRTRPTAVNLFHALDRMTAALERGKRGEDPVESLLAEADRVLEEDVKTGRRIGEHGLAVFPQRDPVTVLTHCNAGGLATGGWGTALAPVYAAARAGRRVQVLADETRPLLQGARLTAWELVRAGIPVRILVDGAAPFVLARGGVDLVIVGADRVAANGDTANKIGTYAVALGAREAGVPFYVAAPRSTFDPRTPDGAGIPVEERAPSEVLAGRAPAGAGALNPAFDVTPARLVTGWITEDGVLTPPFGKGQAVPGAETAE